MSLHVLQPLGTKTTERGTAFVLKVNGQRCLCFPGLIDTKAKTNPTALWPADVTDPFPPALPDGPDVPTAAMESVSIGDESQAYEDGCLIARGALADCIGECFDADGNQRSVHAARLAEIARNYRWLDGPRHYTVDQIIKVVK